MLDRDGYPPGVPCWVDMAPPDPRAAVAFYRDLFGWQFEDRTPAGSDRLNLVAQVGGRDIWMAFYTDSEGNTFALTSEHPTEPRVAS